MKSVGDLKIELYNKSLIDIDDQKKDSRFDFQN